MINNSGKTAISRKTVSAPMKFLFDNAYLENEEGEMLDYGCGKGFDADHFNMDKYDLNHFPETPNKKYDLITCNYVLNVIEVEEDRVTVLNKIKSLLKPKGIAYISVRRDVKRDGFTSKGTFQANVELGLPLIVEKKNKFSIYELLENTSI